MTVDRAPLGAGTQQQQACVEKGVPSFRFHMETIIRKSRWLCFPDTFKIRYFDTSAANMRSTILSYLEIIKMSPPVCCCYAMSIYHCQFCCQGNRVKIQVIVSAQSSTGHPYQPPRVQGLVHMEEEWLERM